LVLPAVCATDGCFGSSISIFTLQIFGLATPITQVIIDKVLVQESLSTLDDGDRPLGYCLF